MRGISGNNARNWGLMACIAAITLAAYSPALSAGFVWNDDDHITRTRLRTWDGLLQIWIDPHATLQYYPLTHSAFWMMHAWWGGRPFGYHLTNITLHIINALLVLSLLRRLKIPGAPFAAMMFAVHPVQVESVAWITELKNTLSGMFALLAMQRYLDYRALDAADRAAASSSESRRWGDYLVAFGFFVAALLSKTVVATLPAALLVILWWKFGKLSWRRDILPLIPWLIAGIGMGLVTSHFETNIWGAAGEQFNFTLVERLLIAGRAVWFYLAALAWPANLVFFYPKWVIDPHQWIQSAYPAAAAALLIVLWVFRRALGRGPLASALLYGGTLFPALGFFNLYWQIYTYVCDHMQYLPCISVFALAAALADRAIRRLKISSPALTFALAAVPVLALASLTWRQCHDYRDARTLFLSVKEKNPTAWMVYENLGEIEFNDGHHDLAIKYFLDAVRLNPTYQPTWANLGLAYMSSGRLTEAADSFRKAIELDPAAPDSYNGLGLLHANQNRFDMAVVDFRKALELKPDHDGARVNLGMALAEQGSVDAAVVEYRIALKDEPGLAAIVQQTGERLFQRGRFKDALAHFNVILENRPADRRAAEWRRKAMSAGGSP